VDIAAKTFTAALCLPDEEPTKAASFNQSSDDFERFKKYLLAKQLPPTQVLVVMEATGTYWIELASFLAAAGFAVSVINPSRMRDYAKSLLLKPKNDFLDAQTLARLAEAQKPTPWTPPPAIYRELSQRLNQRADLMEIRQQLKNQLHALSVYEASPSVVKRLELLIATFTQQIKELDQEIKATIEQEAQWAKTVALLETITGIGQLTACWLVVLTLNFSTCPRVQSLVHYAGLAPYERRSGSSVRGRPMIGHGGNSTLRALFYMAAGSAIRYNPIIKEYYQRLREKRGKPAQVARCAAARKLLQMAHAVATKKQAFDPEYETKAKAKGLEAGSAKIAG
jgi:transposase